MICLDDLFKLDLKDSWAIHSLAFSESGNLGVAPSDYCAYVFDPNGKLLNKICEKYAMSDVSYCCGKFGFINRDEHAYIMDERGNLIKKVRVGEDYDEAITMRSNGFVACWSRCALFNFNGKKKWDVGVGEVDNGPAYYKGYWYMADRDWKKLLIIRDGTIVNSISYREGAYDTAVCGKYLAVATYNRLYLYDLSDPENPKEVWKVGGIDGGWQVAFSSNCKYIAVADINGHKLKVYNILGGLMLEKYYGDQIEDDVTAVTWWKDKLAVGLNDGRVYVYSMRKLKLLFPLLPTNLVTGTRVRGKANDLFR